MSNILDRLQRNVIQRCNWAKSNLEAGEDYMPRGTEYVEVLRCISRAKGNIQVILDELQLFTEAILELEMRYQNGHNQGHQKSNTR